MSDAIHVLKHEHDAILMALDILDRMADAAQSGAVTTADIADFLAFLREFADKCHHGKEEGLLFPALVDAGLPAEGGPVGQMLLEHGQGRDMVAAMAAASDPVLKPDDFARAVHAYGEHMRQHIAKENNVLFPMAEQMLAPDVLASLSGRFEEHEEQVIGHGRHEELHDMLKVLKARYLG